MDVLTFGESMISFRAAGPLALNPTISATIAGAESNVAIALARLGHEVQWAGRVGNDAGGELIRRTLRAEAVGQDHVTTDFRHQTGILLFEQRLPDVTNVSYFRRHSAGAALMADDVLPALIRGPRVLHVTGITCALSPSAADAVLQAAAAAHAAGITVTFDVNYRAKLWERNRAATTLGVLVPFIDIVIGSRDELTLLAGDTTDDEAAVASALLRQGIREVVVKLGVDGARLYDENGMVHSPARDVIAVDSVGAGDAFTAGYISALLTSCTAAKRLRRANTLGAFAVSSRGDWEGLPMTSELALLDAEGGTTIR